MKQRYEGKAKIILETDEPDVFVQRFKDSATAFNAEKRAEFPGKGALCAAIAAHFFGELEAAGVATHFIALQEAIDMRVRALSIVPLEVVVRNVAAGSLSERLGMPEGERLERPIVEMYWKRDDLGDPLLTDEHITLLGLADEERIAALRERALAANHILAPLLRARGIELIDIKLELGRDAAGRLLIGDEISPDTCRLWDVESGRKLDKDVFRRDLAELVPTYREVARRLGVELAPG